VSVVLDWDEEWFGVKG